MKLKELCKDSYYFNKNGMLLNINCLDGMKCLNDESMDLFVTSPPYFNAREYSQYSNTKEYMDIMRNIFQEAYRTLKNHKYVVLNVGDIISQIDKAKWSTKKLPLGAMFTIMMEEIGFEFIDDYIWDKGEPQSKRHIGNPPYPFYQYPVNCYEHILIFVKHEFNNKKIPCPICNETIVVSNSCSGIGIQSWECKNPSCQTKSKSGRGKRYSERSIMMNNYKTKENIISNDFIKTWRRDIVKINPVIKINNKKENKIGHTAPFPKEIPEMAIRYFSGKGDIVCDMFMGSGTTAIVCEELCRKWIGFEMSEEYCEIIKKRMEV